MGEPSELRSQSEVGWVADADDSFVGVRPEAEALSLMEPEPRFDGLTTVKSRAAGLMGELLDASAVDTSMGLRPGQTKDWMTDATFEAKAKEVRQKNLKCRVDVDLGRILTPNQRKAARMLSLGMKQIHVAKELEVTDRTIRNWEAQPAFRTYTLGLTRIVEARREKARLEAEADREKARRKLDSLELEGRTKAIEFFIKRMEDQDDARAAGELMKLRT